MLKKVLQVIFTAVVFTGLVKSYAAGTNATLTIFYSNDVTGYLLPCG